MVCTPPGRTHFSATSAVSGSVMRKGSAVVAVVSDFLEPAASLAPETVVVVAPPPFEPSAAAFDFADFEESAPEATPGAVVEDPPAACPSSAASPARLLPPQPDRAAAATADAARTRRTDGTPASRLMTL